MPYGSGSRECLGMPQARVTMLATLAVMLSRFSFRLADKVGHLEPPSVLDAAISELEHAVNDVAVYHQYKRAGSTDLLIVPLSHFSLELTDKVDHAVVVSPCGTSCGGCKSRDTYAAHNAISCSPTSLHKCSAHL